MIAMRTFVLGTLLILFLLPLGNAATASPVPQTINVAEVIDALNAARFQGGRYPFILNTTLMEIAQFHSDYQAAIGEMTHVGPEGSASTDRAVSAGYGGGETIRVNEMVYSGTDVSPAAAIDFWLNSDIHKSILLSEEYHQFGVGVSSDGVYTYITVNVGLVMGITSALPLVQATPIASDTANNETLKEPLEVFSPAPVEDSSDLVAILESKNNIAIAEENSDPSVLQNSTFLWAIIIAQSLIIAGLAYYIVNVQMGRLQPKNKLRPATIPPGDKPFAQLSHEEQFKHLEKLAQKAVEQYDFEEAHITPIQYRLNASFQVEALAADDLDAGLQKYLLRINSPTFQSGANILSELQWLAAIHRDTNLVVPEPIMSIHQKLITTIEIEGVPGARHVVVLRWVEGNPSTDNLTPGTMTKLGAFVGNLHLHAEGYNPPVGFDRKQWDLAGFSGEMLDVPVTKARRGLSAMQLAILKDTANKIKAVTDELGRGSQAFGLIHANLHQQNVLFHQGEVRAIDFDMCGWGYYLYDLAVILSKLIREPNFPKLKNALLDGYRQVRRLPRDQEALILPFIAARIMNDVYWLAGHKNETAFSEDAPRLLLRNIEYLQQFSQRT